MIFSAILITNISMFSSAFGNDHRDTKLTTVIENGLDEESYFVLVKDKSNIKQSSDKLNLKLYKCSTAFLIEKSIYKNPYLALKNKTSKEIENFCNELVFSNFYTLDELVEKKDTLAYRLSTKDSVEGLFPLIALSVMVDVIATFPRFHNVATLADFETTRNKNLKKYFKNKKENILKRKELFNKVRRSYKFGKISAYGLAATLFALGLQKYQISKSQSKAESDSNNLTNLNAEAFSVINIASDRSMDSIEHALESTFTSSY